jgi:hypothetical protein
LIVKITHISLNARGGAERLAVVTIKTLNAMGIDVELETMEIPDNARISQAFGATLELGMMRITKLRPFRQDRTGNPDLTPMATCCHISKITLQKRIQLFIVTILLPST